MYKLQELNYIPLEILPINDRMTANYFRKKIAII